MSDKPKEPLEQNVKVLEMGNLVTVSFRVPVVKDGTYTLVALKYEQGGALIAPLFVTPDLLVVKELAPMLQEQLAKAVQAALANVPELKRLAEAEERAQESHDVH